MHAHIRPYDGTKDLPDLVDLTLLAFEPVFASFARLLGPHIYPLLYPDWRKRQAEGIEALSKNEKVELWVAEVDGKAIGYIAWECYPDQSAEVQLLAVHPGNQNHGVGTELNLFALQKMKAAGMKLAVVATGGDESHAPARRTYEKAGFTPLPLVRFYQDL